MDGAGAALIIILCLIVIVVICSTIKIVPQAHAYVIERLGTYQATWSVGLHMKMPVIDKVAKKVTLKEQVVDFAPQPVIILVSCGYPLSIIQTINCLISIFNEALIKPPSALRSA